MREYKFRAYRKSTGVVRLLSRLNFKTKQLLFEGSNIPITNKGDFVVMSSTGLNDVDGVDIFEEDILYCKTKGHLRVTWNLGQYDLVDSESNWVYNLYHYISFTPLKVVGNTFENGELMFKGLDTEESKFEVVEEVVTEEVKFVEVVDAIEVVDATDVIEDLYEDVAKSTRVEHSKLNLI